MSEANGVLRNHYHPPGATIYIEKRLTNQSYRLFSQPHFLEISGKPGILIEKILGESGKVRDNRLNSYKNDLFSPLLRDFGNLKSVLIDKILQKRLVNRQNFAIWVEIDLLVDKI